MTSQARDVDTVLADIDAVLAGNHDQTIGVIEPQDPDTTTSDSDSDSDSEVNTPTPPSDTTPRHDTTPVPDLTKQQDETPRDETPTTRIRTLHRPLEGPLPLEELLAPERTTAQEAEQEAQAAAAQDGTTPRPIAEDTTTTEAVDDTKTPDGQHKSRSDKDRLRKNSEPDSDDEDPEDQAASAATKIVVAVKNSGAFLAGTSDSEGLINNPRGRQVVFAATAYTAGWYFHLDTWFTALMDHADQYSIPVAACALLIGLVALYTRTRIGGALFVCSLGLITVLQMVQPTWVVGGGVAAMLQIVYRAVRGWIGNHSDDWPWKAVLWITHIPAATATVALLLYGTN